MDKQKKIEEMVITAYPIYATMEDSLRKEAIECMSSYTVFERLYNAGYRKIPENAVVLTEEEYKKLIYWEGRFDEIVKFAYETTRKETAEKFAERLKARFHKSREYYEVDTGTAWSNGHVGGLINDTIDEIAKEIKEGKV